MAAPESSAPRLRVAAILTRDDKLVLVKHLKEGRTYYLLPGGGVEYGETLIQALQREVCEETGLWCEPSSPVLLSDTIAPDGTRHMVQVVFLADITEGELAGASDDPRVHEALLVAPEDILRLDFRPPLGPEVIRAMQEGCAATPAYVSAAWLDEAAQGSDE